MKKTHILLVALLMLISCVKPKDKRQEANELIKEEKFEKALIAINKAIELEPDSISNYTIRIIIYDATGRFEEEIADLTKIIELDRNGKLVDAYHQRAVVRTLLGYNEQALTDIDYYINSCSTDTMCNLAEAFLNKASIYYKLNNLKKAKEFYELTIKENNGQNNNIESQALVGLANLTMLPQDALKIINEALKIDDKSSIAYGARAALYLDSFGKVDEALNDLKKAIMLNPKDAVLYFNMGQLYTNYRNQLDSAVVFFNKAIELSPQSPDNELVFMNLAVISHRKGNLGKAIAEFKKAESINSENDLLLYNYAMALSDLGNETEALLKISKAININSKDEDYFNLKGSILLGLSDFKEAEDAFQSAIRINSKYGEAYYNLGYLFGVKNEHVESIKYYDKAVNLNFDLEATLVNRALQKLKMNRISEACIDLKRAYKLGRTDIKPLMDKYCN